MGRTSCNLEAHRNLLHTKATFLMISSWDNLAKIFAKISFGRSKMVVMILTFFKSNFFHSPSDSMNADTNRLFGSQYRHQETGFSAVDANFMAKLYLPIAKYKNEKEYLQ